MFLPLGFFLSIALHNVFTTAEPGCDGFGWTHFEGACYKAFAYFFTRSQADTVCQKVGGEAAMWGIFHGTTNLDITEEKYVLTMWQPPAVAAGAEFGLICRKRAVEKPSVLVCPAQAAAPAKPVPAEPAVQRGRGGLADSAASDSASSNSKRQSSSISGSKQSGPASHKSDQNNLVINFYSDKRRGEKRGSLPKGQRQEESEVNVNSRRSRDEAGEESELRQSKNKRFGQREINQQESESEARSSSDYDVVSEDASSDQSASSFVNEEASSSSASRLRSSKKEEASSFAAKSSKRSFSSSASSLS